MDKSPEAFRTISEVADTLETPAHVLRFWESRFPQIRPVKRAGGRRYYRPADVALLTGIKRLLHDEGLTIRGVQKILREQGVRHVAGLAGLPEGDLAPFDAEMALETALTEHFGQAELPLLPPIAAETAQIFALETALQRVDTVKPAESGGVPLHPEAEVLALDDLAEFGLDPANDLEDGAWDIAAPDLGPVDDRSMPAPQSEPAPPSEPVPLSEPAPPLAPRLRAMRRLTLHQQTSIRPLRDRMIVLRQHLAATLHASLS